MHVDIDTEELARRIRIHAVKMTNSGRSSHVGSCLSVADILAVLYGRVMRDCEPTDARRDRLVMSKGHAGAAVYAVLAETGHFSTALLQEHCQDGSPLCGHVSSKGIAGVEVSTGSLGHGLSVGAGMALAGKLAGADHRVFVVLSDGECDEGSIWEAALFAAHHGLDNLTAVIDYNGIQSIGTISDTLALEPFDAKWESFGWQVASVDGHDHEALTGALGDSPIGGGKPAVCIAKTTKGKGVSFMENTVLWHYRSPAGEEFEAALAELEAE